MGQRPWAQAPVYHEQDVPQEADHEPPPSHGRAPVQQERPERERSKAPASSKMQPQLQHLPRFQPPCFEDYNGNLPCPDSPGSTPRDDDEEPQADSSVREELPPPPRREHVPGEGRSRSKRSTESYAAREADSGRTSEASHAVPSILASLDRPAIFAPGSFVEYKSRSSGAWILAKVEDWNESSQTYRLDVQPHAHVDRVRPRNSEHHHDAFPHERERDVRNERDGAGGRERHGRHREQREHAADHGRERDSGHDRHEATPFQNGYSHHRAVDNVLQPPISTLADLRAEEGHCANSMLRDVEYFQDQAVNAYTGRLFTEIESLKQQVMQLQSENEMLQERVKHEAAQKDCYFSELCACHEQLNRARGTPR